MNTEEEISVPPALRLRLDFYAEAVLLSRWQEDGRLTTYPVSVHDVVSACTQVECGSGLLSADTLFWQQKGNQAVLGIYVPARRWQVQTEQRSYPLPLPPFVFVGYGTAYQVFAVNKRPFDEQAQLYHAPCPNVYASGTICQGSTPFPTCAPQTIHQALHLFLEGSLFNADLSRGKCRSHPEDVRELWAELDGRKRFPLSELMPMQRTIHSLL